MFSILPYYVLILIDQYLLSMDEEEFHRHAFVYDDQQLINDQLNFLQLKENFENKLKIYFSKFLLAEIVFQYSGS
jgi:hypothetical protein